MSLEIGELVIQVQVVDDKTVLNDTSLKHGDSVITREEQAQLIEELAQRVVERVSEKWRERR